MQTASDAAGAALRFLGETTSASVGFERAVSVMGEALPNQSYFLSGGGPTGALIRAYDWATTPLGPAAYWPQSLKSMVGACINSPLLTTILWGPELRMIYNDNYAQLLADRHPAAMSRPVSEVWGDAWAQVSPPFERAMTLGEGFEQRNVRLEFERDGRPEVTWWDITATPIRGEDGSIVGLLNQGVEITRQVHANERAATEQQRQQRLLNQMPGFVAVLSGRQHVYEYVNDAYVKISGPRAFIGCSVREVFPELDGQGFYELLDQVYTTGQQFVANGFPIQLTGEDQARYIDFLYEPIRDEAGAVTGIFVGRYDVTETYRTANAIRELNTDLEQQVAERAFGLAQTWAVSPDLLGALNSEGYFETSNPAWKSLLGWSPEEIHRTSIWELLHPEDVERTRSGFALTQIGEPAVQFPNRYRHKNGSYRWISWVGVPQDGLVYCTGRDITAARDQEVVLAQRTAERDRIWRYARDVITVVDPAGVLTAVNPAAAEVLGWMPSEMIGRSVMDFIHPDDRPPLQDGYLIRERYSQPRLFLNRFLHKDGIYRYMSWFSASSEEGEVYSSGRDTTTEREQAEALVTAQESLRQSQKMEAVGQLTGGIAHDFNNLLTGISGSLEMLQARISQGKFGAVDRYVNAAQGAAKRAAALTHRLLAFSRRQTLDPKSTDLNKLIADIEDLVRRTAGPQINVEVVGAGGLWATLVDPNQLENALLNLCINARDAMPNGGQITIETANKWLDETASKERDLPPGQYVTLCVTDTGTGMTPEVIARAFDPFYTTKPLGEGTGLGLSMVYGFVRQSGGQVRIYSELNKGTTMCLYLPRDHAATGADARAPIETDGDPHGAGEVVLIVDDEPTIRMLIAEVLADFGYAGIEASDGPTGLKVLQTAAKIDLLITDVGLRGGLNGRQLADAARVAQPNLKVLFITGYAENAVMGNGHLAVGMQVLTKPFAMDVLARRIREMLER